MRRPKRSHAALTQARRGNSKALMRQLERVVEDELWDISWTTALAVAEEASDYPLLIRLLERAYTPQRRSDALAVVLNIADESHPQFSTLLSSLNSGERTLVLGTLLDVSRLDADAERRLLRLKKLMRVIPQASRSLYWPEAEILAAQGGDDAQLTLIGFARELPSAARAQTFVPLRRAVERVRNAFKRTTAFIALAELCQLSQDDLREADVSAAQIPDETLLIMTLARLSQLKSQESG